MQLLATEESVWRVCDQLTAEGRKITGRKIKAEIGGGLDIIYDHIDTWRLKAATSTLPAEVTPDYVQSAMNKWVSQSNEKATSQLMDKLGEAEARSAEVLEELTCQEELIAVMASESLAMKNQLNELQQLKEQESAVSASTILGLREQLAKLEQENILLSKSVEAERIVTAKVRLQLEYTEDNFTKSAEKVVTLEERLSELKMSHAEADKAKAVAEQRAQTFSHQVAQFKENLKKADMKISECDSVLAKTSDDLNRAMAAQQKAEGVAEQMSLRIQESFVANDQLRTDLVTVRQEAAISSEKMELRLQESNATISQLRAESDKFRIESTISLEKMSLDLQKSNMTIEQLQKELASVADAAGECTATIDQ